ncbi:MAG: hypothetical protein HOW73_18590 [Polyangiaceae bacterium]|nr:hypothetical protein [Polyangiaceae bacterium]
MSNPAHPAWQRLAIELGELSRVTGAKNGYVLDAWANLWCAGNDLYFGGESAAVMELTEAQLATLPRPLNRGGRIDEARDHTYFRSFAGVYVLVLRFQQDFHVETVRSLVAKALPKVEALTLLLPPRKVQARAALKG